MPDLGVGNSIILNPAGLLGLIGDRPRFSQRNAEGVVASGEALCGPELENRGLSPINQVAGDPLQAIQDHQGATRVVAPQRFYGCIFFRIDKGSCRLHIRKFDDNHAGR